MPHTVSVCRYFAAGMLLLYGFAKINGAQFTILDSELDKPMGHVSGFWLTWYYFGFSTMYGNGIAVLQIAGAILLTFRRTTLIAACALLPLVINIVLVNLAYGIDPGALLMSLLLTGCLCAIVAQHRDALVELFWTRQAAREDSRMATTAAWLRPRLVRGSLRATLVLSAALFTWWVAHHNNRAPTPLDGRWQVLSGTYRAPDMPQPLSHVYFELNRAHMCVLRFGDRWSGAHHFLIDTTTRTIGLWRVWNRPPRDEDRLFSGTYELDGNGSRLVLRGTFSGSLAPAVLVLQRVGGGAEDAG
jgi:hypothetical protein